MRGDDVGVWSAPAVDGQLEFVSRTDERDVLRSRHAPPGQDEGPASEKSAAIVL